MYRGKSIGVVIPSYNEELLIGETLASIPDYVDRIYAVDDGSKDGTPEIIASCARSNAKIVPIRHDRNMGVGAAICSGYREALNDGMDIAAVMAGDNQMDPDHLPALLDPIVDERADYTKGNRLISRQYWKGMSRWRFLGNSILTFLTRISSGYWDLMDPQNGYTAISRRALERNNFDALYRGYGYCNELLINLNIYGFRVADVVIPAKYGREKSKIRYMFYIPKVSWLLLRNFFRRLKMEYVATTFNPLVLFYLFGFLATPVGMLSLFYSLYAKFAQGGPIFTQAMLSFLILMMGVQSLFFAMYFDMQAGREGAKGG